MIIYKVKDILDKLENAIKYRLPFSHIRFGDGGIKLLDAIINRNDRLLNDISYKEGIPVYYMVEIIDLWAKYARMADFIDTPEVYFNGKFWPRLRSPTKEMTKGTERKMKDWKILYNNFEFDNDNYCNPESNYLMLIRRYGCKNLFDLLKGKKICCITVFEGIKECLHQFNIDVIKIARQYENQFQTSFHYVVESIKYKSPLYDVWLVAAGELGRIYSGLIKEYGGRTVDIGFIAEFWMGEDIHPRLHSFLNRSVSNRLELNLTDVGNKFQESI